MLYRELQAMMKEMRELGVDFGVKLNSNYTVLMEALDEACVGQYCEIGEVEVNDVENQDSYGVCNLEDKTESWRGKNELDIEWYHMKVIPEGWTVCSVAGEFPRAYELDGSCCEVEYATKFREQSERTKEDVTKERITWLWHLCLAIAAVYMLGVYVKRAYTSWRAEDRVCRESRAVGRANVFATWRLGYVL